MLLVQDIQDKSFMLFFLIKKYVIICSVRGEIMLKTKDILDEKDKRLHEKAKEVKFPLAESDKKAINDMIEYLTNSQIDELAEKYNLRPGMGMAAVQLGIMKRYYVVVHEYEPGKFHTYVLINPEIISNSEEKIYVEEGEGCLSVNREVDGIVPRYARVTMHAYDINGKEFKVRGREDLAIVFQHELDHLNGIMFTDHIDPKNPFKDKDKMRAI